MNEDRIKWNDRYIKNTHILVSHSTLLESQLDFLFSRAKNSLNILDLACGMGRNTIFLSKSLLNYFNKDLDIYLLENINIDAFDISDIAISNLETNLDSRVNVNLECIDLDNFNAKKKYDFIISSLYLNRGIIKNIKDILYTDSIFLFEGLLFDEGLDFNETCENNYLKECEIPTLFGGLTIEYKNIKIERGKDKLVRIIEILAKN